MRPVVIPVAQKNTLSEVIISSHWYHFSVSIPASFTFAKGRFPAREGLRTAMIATLIMPPVTFLVPSYVMMANLGLIDTYTGLTLPLTFEATRAAGLTLGVGRCQPGLFVKSGNVLGNISRATK